MSKEIGKIYIEVVSAKNLPITDLDGLSDPYVVFNFGNHKYQTSVCSNTLSPVWNELFVISVTNEDDMNEFKFYIYDKDKMKTDDQVGKYEYDLKKLKDGVLKIEDFHIITQSSKKKKKDSEHFSTILFNFLYSKERDLDRKTPFFNAINNKNQVLVRRLAPFRNEREINVTDSNGETPIHVAFEKSLEPSCIQSILHVKGIDLSIASATKQLTPIQHLFLYYSQNVTETQLTDILDIFKFKQVDMQVLNQRNENLIHLAVRNESVKNGCILIQWLLNAYPNLELKTMKNEDEELPIDLYKKT